MVTTRADGDTVRRLLTSGRSRNGTLVPTRLLPGTPFPLRLNGSLAGGRQEPFVECELTNRRAVTICSAAVTVGHSDRTGSPHACLQGKGALFTENVRTSAYRVHEGTNRLEPTPPIGRRRTPVTAAHNSHSPYRLTPLQFAVPVFGPSQSSQKFKYLGYREEII